MVLRFPKCDECMSGNMCSFWHAHDCRPGVCWSERAFLRMASLASDLQESNSSENLESKLRFGGRRLFAELNFGLRFERRFSMRISGRKLKRIFSLALRRTAMRPASSCLLVYFSIKNGQVEARDSAVKSANFQQLNFGCGLSLRLSLGLGG